MNKKAQAALEFLTTYGWAFLVILIMIGTLAYFGILSPGKFLPNRCTFGTEFQCIDYQIAYGGGAAGIIRLKLKNNVGEPITIGSISLGSEGATAITCGVSPTLPAPWKSGNVSDFVWTGCTTSAAGLTQGEKGKILVNVNYYSVLSGSNYAKEAKGEILSTVI